MLLHKITTQGMFLPMKTVVHLFLAGGMGGNDKVLTLWGVFRYFESYGESSTSGFSKI